MGAVFGVPLARASMIAELPGATIALVPEIGASLAEVWRSMHATDASGAKVPELTLLVGGERDGLPTDLIEQADHVARIPIATHSLNAAMAATVALYEVTRMAPES
jgi:TrmH family RNA methyltransferase